MTSLEKVAARTQPAAEDEEEEGVVVVKPDVARARGRKHDVATLETDMTSSDEEELSFDAGGVGTLGTGTALGSRFLGETRPREKDGRTESAPLVRGRQKDGEGRFRWWANSSGMV